MNTKKLTFCGVIAALYAGLTIANAGWSYGPMQLRLSELLCILAYFHPSAVWGLTLGCFLANLLSTLSPLDLVFGTAATCLGGILSSKIRNIWLFPLPVILCNALLVGVELSLTLTPGAFWAGLVTYAGQVGLSETAILYLGGVPLLALLRKNGLGQKISEIR